MVEIQHSSTNINSRFFSSYYGGRSGVLAVWSSLSKNFPAKKIKTGNNVPDYKLLATTLKMSESTFKKHLKVLIADGYVRIEKNIIYLMINKDIDNKFCSTKRVYLRKTNTYKEAKLSIESIVFYSAISKQSKKIKKLKNLSTIKHKVDNNEFLTKSEYRYYSRNKKLFENLKGEINTENISLNGILKLINKKSKSTAIRFKRKMGSLEDIKFIRAYEILFNGVSRSEFIIMKKNDIIPIYAKYYNKCVYVDISSRVSIGNSEYKCITHIDILELNNSIYNTNINILYN